MMGETKPVKFGIITVSDTCYKEPQNDRSGPRLAQLVRDAFLNSEVICSIMPDECDIIQTELKRLIATSDVRVILTTGGTGFAPRDVTPEATMPLIDKNCPQLAMAIALASLQKTQFAALTRGVCGIAGETLILNFPGSEKAAIECFEVVRDLLPHAINLISNDLPLVRRVHDMLQVDFNSCEHQVHMCPHVTGAGDDHDRNSPYPMVSVKDTIDIIFNVVKQNMTTRNLLEQAISPVHIPPFRASIKDGYAMKSSGFSGIKRVMGSIYTGTKPISYELQEDECFKINTGAPIPKHADCVIQIEDTKLLKRHISGDEELVEILVEPRQNLDIRPIGHDLTKGSKLFPIVDHSSVVIRSLMASVGEVLPLKKPKIAVLSTGNELLAPLQSAVPGKIYDSNTTMLEELLNYFGFDCIRKEVIVDDFDVVTGVVSDVFDLVDFVICTGGVSMGDKDYIKHVLKKIDFQLHVGRVNIKPGKPMTFATRKNKYFFGLPGNPVSAFVTFHLFALPAIRWADGWQRSKCELPIVQVKLTNTEILLDSRPEFVRASVTSKNGVLYASINGDQISSRLQSIVGADVLVHLPGRTCEKTHAKFGDLLNASVLRNDFISSYE